MDRRTFVRGVGGGSAAGLASAAALSGLAGCLTRNGENEEPAADEGPLRVATYSSMAAGTSPAGQWLRETVEDEFDEEIDWTIPEAGIEHYIQRARLGTEVDADVFLGLTAGELSLVDNELEEHGDTQLFESLDRGRLDHADRVRDDLAFEDPRDRVLPFDTGYVTLVYDDTELEEPPETFDDLLADEFADTLLAQDPRLSDPGRAFLLWTIVEFGSEYLDYWRDLQDNGVRIDDRWTDAYADAYLDEERPMVVSYSTDQVAANDADRDLQQHQIATLDGQGYQNTEGVAVFADANRTELAYEFVDLALSRTAQAEIAMRNVQFPAVEDEYVDLDEEFLAHAQEPDEAVTLTYDDLRGELGGWLAAWDDEIAD